MDFDHEVETLVATCGVSQVDAVIIVAKRFLVHPAITPRSKAMLEVLLDELGEGCIIWQ
jgi:hypothetical protein